MPSAPKLENIRIVHSPLSDSIFIIRVGVDKGLALDKREAEADLMTALVDHMMYNAPKGSEKDVTINGKSYTVRVTPK